MKIAQLKGEKTVKTLVKHLLAERADGTSEESTTRMEAALLRANPQLTRIGSLEAGTPILVPPEIGGESPRAQRSLAGKLLAGADTALKSLAGIVEATASQASDEAARAQEWLKGEQARAIVKNVPQLKEDFGASDTAAKQWSREQADIAKKQVVLLDRLRDALAAAREAPER